ncbi:hypothetical protein [Sulfurirhabdus autotrophica]|uniref:hypothetical protein n=1 Tax=Sulfurirhabdus autotrophica TaxID=1706046 RepID=UPI001404E323|nr:hypothetical protein [Sulfurirhabdus autotrophica]
MFQDEARFGRISDTRHCWCPKPMRPMAKAMVTQDTPMPMPPFRLSMARSILCTALCERLVHGDIPARSE